MSMSVDEDLRLLEVKVGQLKRDYEQYFLGSRPREPVLLLGEVKKQIVFYSNTAIQNTAMRFKFNSIVSRYHALKRQWDATLRQIEAGTYRRHLFKADLHDRQRGAPERRGAAASKTDADIFDAYREAAAACGQDVRSLTREKLQSVIRKQETALRKKLGCERVNFRVVVEKGKVKLKASPVRG